MIRKLYHQTNPGAANTIARTQHMLREYNGLAGGGKSQNDGTIPIASAKAIPKGFSKTRTVEMPYGHSEIMQTFDLVEQIRMFVDNPIKDVINHPLLSIEQATRGF